MKNKLYIRNDRVFAHGNDDDLHIDYSGAEPEFVIRVGSGQGASYFTSESEAAKIIDQENTEEVTLLPVES